MFRRGAYLASRLAKSSSQITFSLFFFFNDTATTKIYTLSLHDALPICLHPVTHFALLPVRAALARQEFRLRLPVNATTLERVRMHALRTPGPLQVHVEDITDGRPPLLHRLDMPKSVILLGTSPRRMVPVVAREVLRRGPRNPVVLACRDEQMEMRLFVVRVQGLW